MTEDYSMPRPWPRPGSLPPLHAAFLERALTVLRADRRVVGVAAGGSYVTDSMDACSDLDLVVVIEPTSADAVMAERRSIAAALGPMLGAFTGEHVGEPRLLICLYGPPVLHVDLKFVALPDLARRVEDPVILWERDGRVRDALHTGTASYPQPDPVWIEDRFWIWIHYGASKIVRGELFEAVDFLALLRGAVLGPLALQRAGAAPTGVRRLEAAAPMFAEALRQTVSAYDAVDCWRALNECVTLYRALRSESGNPNAPSEIEQVVMDYVKQSAAGRKG
jgi:hypothetical protein